MPFLRFSRDKRGYEQFALVHPVIRRGKSVTRLLYWYRTPPDVKVGREPFDEEVRRALEAQNPDVTFDWRQILETPIPSADADKWRERRRTDRLERAARQAFERDDESGGGEEMAAAAAPKHVLEVVVDAEAPVDTLRTIEAPEFTTPESVVASVTAEASDLSEAAPDPSETLVLRQAQDARGVESGLPRRKRRRRRRRGRQGAAPAPSGADPAAPSTATPTVAEGEEHAADQDE